MDNTLTIKPDMYVRGEARYSLNTLNNVCARMISTEDYFYRKGKIMSKDLDEASNVVDEATKRLGKTLDILREKERDIAASVKSVSGTVRDSTQKLSNGLAKIEGKANFDRLERYVALLERANAAMSSLAELEQSGRLDKIASAIR